MGISMPSLTVRSFAEMLGLPAHAQARILTEQKYPKQGPQAFKTPYYQQSLAGIRAFYKAGNDEAQLAQAAKRIEGFSQNAKRDNNLRILGSFRQSELFLRKLQVDAIKHLTFTTKGVDLRFSPDVSYTENGDQRMLLLHYRAQPLDPELARTTLELAHWALNGAGMPVEAKRLEYFDLFSVKSFSIERCRTTTVRAAEQNVKIIQALWQSI